jgi:hypothetical protein
MFFFHSKLHHSLKILSQKNKNYFTRYVHSQSRKICRRKMLKVNKLLNIQQKKINTY